MGGQEKEGMGRGKKELPSDISHCGNAAFRHFNPSQPQNSQVLVSCLRFRTSFYVGPRAAGHVFVDDDLLAP